MTGTRKNKGGHFWHIADYFKERGDTAKQNRGFFRSGPLRPAEAENANKTERSTNRKPGDSARALLGTHPNGGLTPPTNIITRWLMHIHLSRVFLTIKPSVYLTSSVYLRTDRTAARAQIEWSRLKRGASAFGSSVLITLNNMDICTLKCIGFLLQQYFANENLCIEHVRMLY